MKENDNKKNVIYFKNIEVVTLTIITCVISLMFGYFLATNTLNNEEVVANNNSELKEFVDVYNEIKKDYFGEVSNNELIEGAINGMLEATGDIHTTIINEAEQDNFNITLEGNYEGLGIEIAQDINGNIIIVTVFDDTPASKAGLKPLDIITKIDDKSSFDLTTAEFSSYVRDSDKSTFNVTVLRNNDELNFEVKREHVVLKSVEHKIIEKENKKIGYIYVDIFAANTYTQFKDALEVLESKGISSLIIDLRGNTGGHLSIVTNMLSLFVDKNHIIYQVEGKDNIEKVYSTGNKNKKYKILLLSNEESASASEVMMGSLKENLGATIIGKKSYGKGSVQELRTLSDGTQYKITIKKWLTPKGNSIDKVGIAPDHEIELTEEYYKNPIDENDVQLKKAIELAE